MRGPMDISVVLERVENNGYRARCGEPIALSAEGDTREEALGRLREALATKMAAGLEVLRLRVPTVTPDRPLWPDDEFTRAWLEGIAEARRQAEANPLPWEKPDPEQR
jgi:predicted RNase H-like HicB family nuclease